MEDLGGTKELSNDPQVVIGLTYLGVAPIRDREQGKKNFRYVKVVEVLLNKKIKVENIASGKPDRKSVV